MANEKRLIDANAMEQHIADSYGYPVVDILHEIATFPTVEAVEVVHGRWIWSEENECWVCSNCELSALNNYRGNSTDSNYCPNCGAKMDGERKCNESDGNN